MILVDTSVWVDHFRRGNLTLRALLHDDLVVTHPFVVGELACGRLANRPAILAYLVELPAVAVVEHEEALAFVEARRAVGAGIGWVDVHLLAAAAVDRADLWTLDKRLGALANRLGLSASR